MPPPCDRLRTRKADRETYVGWWLPEPLVELDEHTPESAAELASDVSIAFMWVLERLSPDERAAFLMRQVFDHDYAEIAAMLNKSEAMCRQMVHPGAGSRATGAAALGRAQDTHRELLAKFMQAAGKGDLAAMKAMMSDEVQLVADGGGKVTSFLHMLHGAGRVAGVYWSLEHKFPSQVVYRPALINGEPGLLRYVGERSNPRKRSSSTPDISSRFSSCAIRINSPRCRNSSEHCHKAVHTGSFHIGSQGAAGATSTWCIDAPEAFSDGVIAIIITIMLLKPKVHD